MAIYSLVKIHPGITTTATSTTATTKTTTTMTILKCKRGHEWDYQGQNTSGQVATCPKCRRLVTIPSLVIAVMLVFGGISLAYAEHPFPIDESYDIHLCPYQQFDRKQIHQKS